ncbi:hypothetical protein [Streptomyces sp. UNOC14_S4]|uniref:hypothetical protein n=1 Tax=Streptomyces sp. UNOC14_S4 TaxID=2872340 RepID=UPI001E2A1C24|nr:hypothetical protein [Streptomyces sp. UNOC14_S4]MCC3767578.1 hypothetical protein [Streptomyces sp. UNOC14_S4]
MSGTGYAVLHVDDDHETALAPLDVKAIKAAIKKSLGKPLAASERATVNNDLKGHLGLLMPIAAGAHPELVASVGRRLEYEPPDAFRYPQCARQWGEESARTAEQLLGLVVADEDAERQYAEAEASLGVPASEDAARPPSASTGVVPFMDQAPR